MISLYVFISIFENQIENNAKNRSHDGITLLFDSQLLEISGYKKMNSNRKKNLQFVSS
jgi:hypothetical protein